MRELDYLLLGWLENAYPTATQAQKAAFEELLALPDPKLIGYLLGGHLPRNAELADVVSHIRDRAAAK